MQKSQIMFVISSLMFLLYLFFIAFIFIKCRATHGALPIVLVLAWFAVKMPFYIFYSSSHNPLFSSLNITIEEFLYLLAIKSIFIFSCAVSYFVFTKKERFHFVREIVVQKWFVAFVLLVGLGFLALYLYNVGGLSYIWNHMSDRHVFTHGYTYLFTLVWMFFSLAVIVSICSLDRFSQVCLTLFCGVALYLAYGSRSLSFSFFIIWFAAYFYWNHSLPFKFYRIRYFVVYVLALVIFVATPLFRVEGAYQTYLNNKNKLLEDISENYIEIFHRFSVPEIEFLVLRYFKDSNYWTGVSFLDAVYFFCPISICKAKPPIDEGVYLYNIYLGNDAAPGTPLANLVASSFPFETWSIMYANFGFAGVIDGGLLYGLILAFFYRLCFSKKPVNQLVGFYSIGLVAVGFFHLSNLYIGLFFIPVFFQLVVLNLVGPLVIRKIKQDG